MGRLRALNIEAACNGVWCPYDPQPLDDMHVKVAMYDSPRAKKWLRQEGADLVADLRTKGMPAAEINERVTCEVLAECCIQDWRNFQGDDGEPLPCEPATVLALLLDPRRIEFREWALNKAVERTRFLEEQIVAAGKNSRSASRGGSRTAPIPMPSPSTSTSLDRASPRRSMTSRFFGAISRWSGRLSGSSAEVGKAA